jgi:hypothetical protein
MDIMSNIILYSVGRELPENVVIVALARDGFWEYRTERGIVLSLMDWVEKFGASTASFSQELVDIDVHWATASDLYLEGDYDSALSEIEEGKSRAQSLREDVLGAKDRVLFWVYVIEYLVISGVSVGSGSMLWTLMVRRSLYRSAKTTRFLKD